MAKEEKAPCEQGTLGEDMQRLTWELIDSLELRKAKRTLRRVLGR